jgi:hypothetical protein
MSRRIDLSGRIDPAERAIEFPHHVAERGGERGPPPDHHIVMPGAQPIGVCRRRQSHDFAQAAAHAVALDGVADLFRYGETDPHWPVLGAAARLYDKSAAGDPHAARRSPKIAAALEPFDHNGMGVPITH